MTTSFVQWARLIRRADRKMVCGAHLTFLCVIRFCFLYPTHLLAIFQGYGILLAKSFGGSAGPFDNLRTGRGVLLFMVNFS